MMSRTDFSVVVISKSIRSQSRLTQTRFDTDDSSRDGDVDFITVRLREGFVNRPGWIALKDGQRPEAVEMWEPGEWHTAGSTARLLVPNAIVGRP